MITRIFNHKYCPLLRCQQQQCLFLAVQRTLLPLLLPHLPQEWLHKGQCLDKALFQECPTFRILTLQIPLQGTSRPTSLTCIFHPTSTRRKKIVCRGRPSSDADSTLLATSARFMFRIDIHQHLLLSFLLFLWEFIVTFCSSQRRFA